MLKWFSQSGRALVACAAVFVTWSAWAQPSGVRSAADHQRHNTVLQAAAAKGSVPVIVELVPQQQIGELGARAPQSQAVQLSELRAKQNRVLSRLVTARSNAGMRTPQAVARLKQFNYFPGIALRASAQDVQALLNDPEVLRVYEEVPRKPMLRSLTEASIGMVSGAFQGRTGAGQVVAVLDSGVDKTHPYLAGKVVAEACFSTTDTNFGSSTSLCPGGASSSTAVDSGAPCSPTVYGCDHGTMVAGVVAASAHPSFGSGVAPSAQLISVQIYSRFDDSSSCGAELPCTLAWPSDEILGLEHVYGLRSTYRIAAANLSLGGGQYSTNCEAEPENALEYAVISSLRAAGIATVASSGNEFLSSQLAAPACMSNVISVGSTTDADSVSGFSNSAGMLQLLAPGEDVTTTTVAGAYASPSGTSFSAPMVSGALAVLREQHPQASVDTLLGLLKNTGLSVVDSRNSLMKPRIRVDQAMSGLDSLTRVPNGKPLANESAAAGQFSYYTVVVPTGASNLSIRTLGGTGNPTMYVRRGSRPTVSTFDCSSSNAGTSETCTIPSPTAGTYHVMLSAAAAYSGVSVLADFDLSCASSNDVVLPTAISGSAEYTTCGTIASNASGTAVPTTGVLQLNAPGGIRLRTGFRVTSGARLWARLYPEMQ
ncbi:S8 family peptidase [Hydrogenophaga pseudoflava]|uniref:S8 family peptidase n=1 Tax=Hydrogenophaga pseudoflava TaxID=47421 RepID=UPI0027E47BEC|nr:S8 family serine peptidase [Hydrogenophaga pseudoflava]MDQ7745538.1 S8 family serine peptidase [Hydrogenophaga pseudoflava]